MDIARIRQILAECQGHADEHEEPADGSEMVDVWIMVPLHREKVVAHANEMIELLKAWPGESWVDQVPMLGSEINYITAGGVLGSQSSAFVLFAYGKMMEWWTVLDPKTVLGIDKNDPNAQTLFGRGYVAIMGYTPAEVSAEQ